MTTWHEKQALAVRVEELERQVAELTARVSHLLVVCPVKLKEEDLEEPKRRGRPPKADK